MRDAFLRSSVWPEIKMGFTMGIAEPHKPDNSCGHYGAKMRKLPKLRTC